MWWLYWAVVQTKGVQALYVLRGLPPLVTADLDNEVQQNLLVVIGVMTLEMINDREHSKSMHT